MNNLKSINDIFGHAAGDQALVGLAADVKKVAGPNCLAARIGGDEFGVVLPVNYDTLSARRVRAHIASGVAGSVGAARNAVAVSASVGIALYPDDGLTAGELYKSADRSMYAHKRGLSVA